MKSVEYFVAECKIFSAAYSYFEDAQYCYKLDAAKHNFDGCVNNCKAKGMRMSIFKGKTDFSRVMNKA